MLMIVLRILSILGIVLLALFLMAVALLLLALFFPIAYRIAGKKDREGFLVSARIKWLFGLVGVSYDYPKPGELKVKVLPFTLYRSKIPSGNEEEEGDSGGSKDREEKEGEDSGGSKDREEREKEDSGGSKDREEKEREESGESEDRAEGGMEKAAVSEKRPSLTGKILQKFEKFKYTIHEIYDKIKEIWDNISYYLELLQEEETKRFLSHVWLRAGEILRNIRPRHIRAEIRFGADSPDTTGYLYGIFCMLAPGLGGNVQVTPDFEEAVFLADFYISGHVTIGVLLWNGGKVALDKGLRRLLGKRKHRKRKTATEA